MSGWIGVDLDGTLAEYRGWRGPGQIGPPVPAMVERVKQWLEAGKDVRVFTARVSHDGTRDRVLDAMTAQTAIIAWCVKHLQRVLPVTCEKDFGCLALYDDRAIEVEHNTGRLVAGEEHVDE